MGKKVLVKVRGFQAGEPAEEMIEVVAAGEYEIKKGVHILRYDEIEEDANAVDGLTKNLLKVDVSRQYVELVKKGYMNTTMVFTRGQTTTTFYDSPYGRLLMDIDTRDMQINLSEGGISVVLRYLLIMNHQPLAENRIEITASEVEDVR